MIFNKETELKIEGHSVFKITENISYLLQNIARKSRNVYWQLNPNSPKIQKFKNLKIVFGGIRVQLQK